MDPIPSSLPMLPIRNAVLFPSISMPLVVGRPRSLRALEKAAELGNLMVVVTQKTLTQGDPSPRDLHSIGTLCKIESVTPTETGSQQIVVTGILRYRIAEAEFVNDGGELLMARGEIVSDLQSGDTIRSQALLNTLKSLAQEILELLPGATEPLIRLIDRVDDPSYLGNVCAAYLNLTIAQKQEILETTDIDKRIELLLTIMRKEREVLSLQREIREKMSERLNKAQREALLREQMRTIRTELGEDGVEETNDELDEKLRDARLPGEVAKVAYDELRRMRSLPTASAEYHVIRSYLESIAAMPWGRSTRDQIDLSRARKILDEDHFGLESVKKRILQFLAVSKLKNDISGPILCLLGPPGVGKTSLGQSIARTLGRKFIRTSLGGVRDEAEIRGHRRTYVGAMPGRILQSIKRVAVNNPVMLLDEIDKLRADFHGDPSAAMLEVFDPEQNKTFTDHYLDVPFDLSNVFFIATANVLETVPAALRDRMEIIEVNGYTTHEKLRIAQMHLLARELKAHGLRPDQVEISEDALLEIIARYTREAGVRELSRKIAALLRAVAERIAAASDASNPEFRQVIHAEDLPKLLGPERFFPERMERTLRPGVATGLAWTPQGGDLLFLEATSMPGKGKLILTGQLGEVMKESAQIALSLARSSLPGIPQDIDFNSLDFHIHVPAGAIPKDGPSAGVTVLVALVSLLLNRAVEGHVCMTGEITLRGAVLPVGGIKEKVLAAHRAEMTTVILPRKNAQDLEEVPAEVRSQMELVFVDNVDELLDRVFPRRRADSYVMPAAS